MKRTTDIYIPTGEIEKTCINSIWRLFEYDLIDRKEIILPKGTVEIIFNFSDIINYDNPSLRITTQLPTVFINGINFKPFELTKTGQQVFIGIQLNTIGLKLLFDISVKEINNRVYKGKDICQDLDTLADKLSYTQTFSQQVEIILTWIRGKISISNYPPSINRAKKLLSISCRENLTVKKICELVCLSDRQLRRFSLDWLGMNTEEFILYQKYLFCLQLLHHSKHTLTEVGLEAGYYDQSHFIREFKSYTEMTPKQYREANTEFPGHIFI